MGIRIGISSCLLGQQVRFDGGHKRDSFLVDTFRPYVEWVAVSPEVEAGLGTPCESMRLVDAAGDVRLVTGKTGTDHTDAMRRYARERVASLANEDLCGYVLNAGLPSCGAGVAVYPAGGGGPSRHEHGLFAGRLRELLPCLPVSDETLLCDPTLREHFIERVFAYRRLRSLFEQGWSVESVAAFHKTIRLQLLAHSPPALGTLDSLVVRAKELAPGELRSRYEAEFTEAMARLALPPKHGRVLGLMVQHFENDLEPGVRRELADVIEDYRCGRVPLLVPLTLIRHYARLLDVAYLKGQSYLEPDPEELMLRNRA